MQQVYWVINIFQWKISRERNIWKGIPAFADRMFQTQIFVPFPQSHIWYQYFVFFCFVVVVVVVRGRFAVNGTGLYKRWMRFLVKIYQSWIWHRPICLTCVNGKQPLFCLMNRLFLCRPRYRRSCYGHYNYTISSLKKYSMSSKNAHLTSICFPFFVSFCFVLTFCLFVFSLCRFLKTRENTIFAANTFAVMQHSRLR